MRNGLKPYTPRVVNRGFWPEFDLVALRTLLRHRARLWNIVHLIFFIYKRRYYR